jgi:hypothetical protein
MGPLYIPWWKVKVAILEAVVTATVFVAARAMCLIVLRRFAWPLPANPGRQVTPLRALSSFLIAVVGALTPSFAATMWATGAPVSTAVWREAGGLVLASLFLAALVLPWPRGTDREGGKET